MAESAIVGAPVGRGNIRGIDTGRDEALVACIRQYPCVYDPQHLDYSRMSVRDGAWLEIKADFETCGYGLNDVAELKTKWKNLRTRYRKLTKLATEAQDSMEVRDPIKWALYESMTWLESYQYNKLEVNKAVRLIGEEIGSPPRKQMRHCNLEPSEMELEMGLEMGDTESGGAGRDDPENDPRRANGKPGERRNILGKRVRTDRLLVDRATRRKEAISTQRLLESFERSMDKLSSYVESSKTAGIHSFAMYLSNVLNDLPMAAQIQLQGILAPQIAGFLHRRDEALISRDTQTCPSRTLFPTQEQGIVQRPDSPGADSLPVGSRTAACVTSFVSSPPVAPSDYRRRPVARPVTARPVTARPLAARPKPARPAVARPKTARSALVDMHSQKVQDSLTPFIPTSEKETVVAAPVPAPQPESSLALPQKTPASKSVSPVLALHRAAEPSARASTSPVDVSDTPVDVSTAASSTMSTSPSATVSTTHSNSKTKDSRPIKIITVIPKFKPNPLFEIKPVSSSDRPSSLSSASDTVTTSASNPMCFVVTSSKSGKIQVSGSAPKLPHRQGDTLKSPILPPSISTLATKESS